MTKTISLRLHHSSGKPRCSMPEQPKEKSTHLQELEAVFDRHTRRFSPFDVLGLRPNQQSPDESALRASEDSLPPTHMSVDATHPHDPPTDVSERGTPLPGEGIHTRVVGSKDLNTNNSVHTHRGVDATHPLT